MTLYTFTMLDPIPMIFVILQRRFVLDTCLITGSIAGSASRRYLVYSEADFEVFRPAGATLCTDGVKFGTGAVQNFTPIGATLKT